MEAQDWMKLSLPPKLMENLICIPIIILFRKIFIPNYIFDALLCWNWLFSRPSRVTLRITLLLSAKNIYLQVSITYSFEKLKISCTYSVRWSLMIYLYNTGTSIISNLGFFADVESA
jgi:hypothetical protein